MSALAMILTAAMVVPGDGPEKVSGEIAVPQRLDLSGKWEAILYHRGDVYCGEAWLGKAFTRLQREFLFTGDHNGVRSTLFWGAVPVDEGNGRFRIGDSLGIYQRDGNRLRICFGNAKCRPTSFCPGDRQTLLILHRVKSRD